MKASTVFLILVAMCVVSFVVQTYTEYQTRAEAVQAGVARYHLNPKKGTIVFSYVTPVPKLPAVATATPTATPAPVASVPSLPHQTFTPDPSIVPPQ